MHAGNLKYAINFFFNSDHLFLLMEKKWFDGCIRVAKKVDYMRHYSTLALVPWNICFLILGIY